MPHILSVYIDGSTSYNKIFTGDDMTAKQYNILLDLFNEMNEEFQRLSIETKDEFMAILYGRKTFNGATGRYE